MEAQLVDELRSHAGAKLPLPRPELLRVLDRRRLWRGSLGQTLSSTGGALPASLTRLGPACRAFFDARPSGRKKRSTV